MKIAITNTLSLDADDLAKAKAVAQGAAMKYEGRLLAGAYEPLGIMHKEAAPLTPAQEQAFEENQGWELLVAFKSGANGAVEFALFSEVKVLF